MLEYMQLNDLISSISDDINGELMFVVDNLDVGGVGVETLQILAVWKRECEEVLDVIQINTIWLIIFLV